MNPNFIYLSWNNTDSNNRLTYHQDKLASVEVNTSVGKYKNNYADFLLQKNRCYYWQIKIIRGTYIKIGIIKQSEISNIKNKAFSDSNQGYAYYSTGHLRHGSNSTGDAFGKGYGPGDTVKIQFNSKTGTLSFGKNDQKLQQAFVEQSFKQGGYVPAIGTLIEGTKYCLTLPDLQD